MGSRSFPKDALTADRNGAKNGAIMGPWLPPGEKNATVAAYSHMELAADRKRALQYLADRVMRWPRTRT